MNIEQDLFSDAVFFETEDVFAVEDSPDYRVWSAHFRAAFSNTLRAVAVVASMAFVGLQVGTAASDPLRTAAERMAAAKARVHIQLDRLTQLGCNWDSSGARPVSVEVVGRAALLVDELLSAEIPPPEVVPTSPGGVQLEWYSPRAEIEVEFVPGQSRVAVLLDVHGEMEEYELEPHVAELEKHLARL